MAALTPAGSVRGAQATAPVAEKSLTVVPIRHWGRWLAAAAALTALVGLIGSLAGNENLHWDIVGRYVFAGLVFDGLATTLWLTAAAMAVGLGLGILVAVMRLSSNPVLRVLANAFVSVFRGTPLLVQIIFWGYAGALYKHILIGIPFTHITFLDLDTNTVLTPPSPHSWRWG